MARHRGLDGREDTQPELLFEMNGEAMEGWTLISAPPVGGHRVVNLFVSADERELVLQFDYGGTLKDASVRLKPPRGG